MSIPGWDRRPRAVTIAVLASIVALLTGCDPHLGVDPDWGSLPLPGPDPVFDDAMADVGAELFRRNCVACHSVGGGSVVGPDLRGVTLRRSPQWIRGMVARPDSMLRVDSIAQALLVQYQVPMLNRKLDPPRVRAVLEFLWRADHASGQVAEPAGGVETGSGGVTDDSVERM